MSELRRSGRNVWVVSLSFLFLVVISMPVQGGGCSKGGGCGGGSRIPGVKGNPSRLPTVSKVEKDRFTAGRKTYIIGDGARITVNGEQAYLSDVTVGMRVMVSSKIFLKGDTVESSLYLATRITATSR